MKYQPIPTLSAYAFARICGWLATSKSSATMRVNPGVRRDSRTYGSIAKPSLVPMMSGHNLSSG